MLSALIGRVKQNKKDCETTNLPPLSQGQWEEQEIYKDANIAVLGFRMMCLVQN